MKKTILLIDDDIDEIELMKEVVAELDPDVDCHYARNGVHALSILGSLESSMPDMIFLDINMPVMNGWEFLKNLKSSPHFKEIPVVVYTTSNRDEDRSMAIRLGACHYIRKPEDYRLLKKELASLILKAESIFLCVTRKLRRTTMKIIGRLTPEALASQPQG